MIRLIKRRLIGQTIQLEKQVSQDTHSFVVKKHAEITPALLGEAKKLHASIYLERSYIDHSDVGSNGYMNYRADPHQRHSEYFIAIDKNYPNKVLVTVRQIRADIGHDQLPILSLARLKTKSKSEVLSVASSQITEISGLAKAHGVPSAAVLELYFAMWSESMKRSDKIWLMACDVKLYNRLKILFGGTITRIGKRTRYKGGDIIPCKLELSASHVKLLKNLHSKHLLYGRVRRAMAAKFLNTYMTLST